MKFSGELVRSLSPDERSAAALIKKVIDTPCGSEFREAAQGVFIRKGGLERLITEHTFAVLDEKGTDVRKAADLPDAFLLSDHLNFTEGEETLIRDCPRYSVGPKCLHADHTITLVHNELDRRTADGHKRTGNKRFLPMGRPATIVSGGSSGNVPTGSPMTNAGGD